LERALYQIIIGRNLWVIEKIGDDERVDEQRQKQMDSLS
jgi:hypothetical protein